VSLRSILIPIIPIAFALPCAAAAQGWRVEAAAGRAVSDPVSARIGSNVGSLGVEYGDSATARWLYLQAGTALGGEGPAWGAGGAGTWLGIERGDFTLGASLGAHLFGYGAADSVASGGGVTAEALPTVTCTRGPLRGELASGVISNTNFGDSAAATRTLSESSARLIAAVAEGVQLSAEGRFLHAGDGDWPYLGGALQVERARYGGWVYAGGWGGSDFPAPRLAFGVGAKVRYLRAELEVGVRQEPMDPLYLNLPRRTWSVQLSHRIGPAPRPAAAPAPPAFLPAVANGTAVFRLPRRDYPQAPVLVGDFSGWRPVAMTADGDQWTATVRLPPGAHHYGFKTADGSFFVPPGVPTVDDGFGGTNAVLVVP
jgi:AMP-activated protein kinase-like protein